MTIGASVLRQYARQLRARQLMRYGVNCLPLTLAGGFALWHLSSLSHVQLLGVMLCSWLVMLLATDIFLAHQRVNAARTAAHLDRRFPALQDSSTLLLRKPNSLSLIENLQRQHVESELCKLANDDALGMGSARRLHLSLAMSLVLVAVFANLTWLVPALREAGGFISTPDIDTQIASLQIDISPPAYTGARPSTSDRPSLELLEFSKIRMTATVLGSAASLSVRTDDDMQITLYAAGDGRWQSEWWQPDVSTYTFRDGERLIPVSGHGTVHTIALLSDMPPRLTLREPESRLRSASSEGDNDFDVLAEVLDDYGVATVTAHVTRSTGSGEQVSFETQTLNWFSDEDASQQAVNIRELIAPLALGLTAGSELYIHLVAEDARPERVNATQSMTIIVRWQTSEEGPDIVLDNQIVDVMPEYFRSQRQVIIDSERLLVEQPDIEVDVFDQRAQSLAIDQKALRLRYGQFMGEENDGEPTAGPEAGEQSASGEGGQDEHYAGDGHDHSDSEIALFSAQGKSEFGDADAAIAPYAHFHDQAEQATLFDPETRGLLAQALSAMWSAEGELRQLDPRQSLPHQYRALALLKRVQNRSRVFVARVGFEPTPVDPARQLTGELEDIANLGRLSPQQTHGGDAGAVVAMTRLLNSADASDVQLSEPLLAWLSAQQQAARDANDDGRSMAMLDAEATLRQWQIDASCTNCRSRLQRFWQRYAPQQLAPASRAETPFDAFAGGQDDT